MSRALLLLGLTCSLCLACLDSDAYSDPDAAAQADTSTSADTGTTTPDAAQPDAVTPEVVTPDADAEDDGIVDGGGDALPDTSEDTPADQTPEAEVDSNPIPARRCGALFELTPGFTPSSVKLAGAWSSWSQVDMTDDDNDGTWECFVELPPGVHAYKFVVTPAAGEEPQWWLDPANNYRAYDDSVENSGMRVGDCAAPSLTAAAFELSAPAGDASATASLQFTRAAGGADPDPDAVTLALKTEGARQPLEGAEIEWDEAGMLIVTVDGLSVGKHTLYVTAADLDGLATDEVRLPFWVEPEAFVWSDTPVYMIMTDRFIDGEPGNNGAPLYEERAGDFLGGDLQGVTQAIEAGHFDALGVKALWLSPWNTNPDHGHIGSDGINPVTGYHGYWPIEPRKVDPRLGGDEALRAMVKTAHEHGIRVLMDLVVNHVHEEHPYFIEHPNWFNTGCVCGSEGCDWTTHRLDCLFAPFMPDVNWKVPEASEAFITDALWWLEEFDLDGFRVDAVKHVEDAAVQNLSIRIREEFEQAGNEHFLLGETAMGWGGDDPANSENDYATISRYIGPDALNGQFDFVLYHGVIKNVFAYSDHTGGGLHVDFWTGYSLEKYPDYAIMTPYIGSHDTTRFVTYASYRGQDDDHARGVADHKWDDLPLAPDDDEPYARMNAAMAWLLTTPGLPLLYYGDEYAEFGGADPDNRHMWRPAEARTEAEAAFAARTERLGQLRAELPALRRGDYRSLGSTIEVLAFARSLDEEVALVLVNLTGEAQTHEVEVPVDLLTSTETLTDRLEDGATLELGENGFTITLPAWGGAVLVP